MVRQTGRYQAMREVRLSALLEKVNEQHELILSDWDIENLIQESQKAGRISRLVSGKSITADKGKKYKAIMAGDDWDELASSWKMFQKDIMKEMNTAVEMLGREEKKRSP